MSEIKPDKIDYNRNRVRMGRPRKYETAEDFENEAEAYFQTCDAFEQPYLITGLALFMGFYGRAEYNEYLNYEGFEHVAAKMKARVETSYETRLQQGKPVGAIFALKNMGWRDERQVDLKSSDGSMTPQVTVTINTAMLPTDMLAMLYEAITVTPNENLLR